MNDVVCLFAKNGLGNIVFEIECAARYAQQFGKSLYVDLNEMGHYNELNRNPWAYFTVNGVTIQETINPVSFSNPYPAKRHFFSRKFIDENLRETKPSTWRFGSLAVWEKYDKWKYHWRTSSNQYGLRNAECLGLIGAQHDAVLYLTTYIRQEPERFFHVDFSSGIKQQIDAYLTDKKLESQPDFGIHVRYTDNLNHAGGRLLNGLEGALSSTQTFINNWYETNERKPVIHLATDNVQVVDLFSKTFDSNSVVQTLPIYRTDKALHIGKFKDRDEDDPYFFAIADIMTLSKSKVLAYMGNSSFSRVARNMQPLHFEAFDWNSNG